MIDPLHIILKIESTVQIIVRLRVTYYYPMNCTFFLTLISFGYGLGIGFCSNVTSQFGLSGLPLL
jgi:hypothetical protein